MIGLAVPELSLPYFAQLADAVIQHAEARGLTVLIEQTGADPAREREALHGHRRQLTDGLIMSPSRLAQTTSTPSPSVTLSSSWENVSSTRTQTTSPCTTSKAHEPPPATSSRKDASASP